MFLTDGVQHPSQSEELTVASFACRDPQQIYANACDTATVEAR